LLASPPGVGKTLFAMEIAAACSENRAAMGGLWPVESTVPVLYLDGEMHWEDLNTRSKTIGLRKTLILSKMVYEFRNGSPPLNIADEEGIRNPLTSIILNQGTKLLILDNIYSLVIGLDHNFEREWSPINQWLISLRNKGVAVILVHHTGKKGDQLGTSSRKFNIDYSFTLEKRPLPGTDFGNCSFRIIVDKERRPVQNVRDKIFYLSDGKWNIDHLSEGETREAEYSNRKVAKLLVQGSRNKDIAKECDCTRANISQIKRRLCDRGLIIFDDESGIYEFTEKGEEWIQVTVN
jgi:AAA domain